MRRPVPADIHAPFERPLEYVRRCQHPGCPEPGAYRAPVARDRLNEFYWFCIEHVREYNLAWDFFAGMSEEEIAVANHMTFAKNLTKVTTGHFGCTMFRADKLRSQPRPWMVPKPSSEGLWNKGTDCVHPDIQFWHDWAKENKTLYVANKVVVGHMEEKVTWPGQDFTPLYQSLEDYMKTGKPAEVKR